ncbi:MAG: hypothetical protein A2293_13320 [Elusimicrobia bacterium RIFOXYB2_FULL_49_7]|nr:MAG: hypothetical protein A2293_13320 [Elusimicrobia bacterium RIFOXYB2_FULL_49_7]
MKPLLKYPGYQQRRFEIFTLLSFSAILILALYVLEPLFSSTTELFSTLLDRRQMIGEAQTFEGRVKRMEKENETIRATLKDLKLTVASDSRLSAIYALLNQAALESGADVASVNMLPENTTDNSAEISFNLHLRGEFNRIGRFTHLMENSGYIVRIREMILDHTQNRKIEAKLRVSIFFDN